MDDIRRSFSTPGPAFRGRPFWAWNGSLEEPELLRQVGVLQEMGFGGFFMHARTGLATEYLGEEWFSLINACADAADRVGLEAWIYDEDRWPSGTAGGMVTQAHPFRMRFIALRVQTPEEVVSGDDLVAAFSCDLHGLDFTDCRRLHPGEAPDQDRAVLAFRIVEMAESPFYNGATYVDTMNPEATAAFIQRTHRAYRRHCGDRIGRSIRGVFTDEPHRGSVMDGFGHTNPDGGWMAPFTPALFDRFAERFGYDLRERLPDLFLRRDGAPVSPVKWQYIELLQELFLTGFLQPIQDWCRQNGLALTGHGLHEDSLTAQTAMTGSLMRLYEHMDHPGMDLLGEHNRCYWVAKQLASAARQTGKRWLLSELYGCTGWQMDFAGHKAVGEWQALFGVNVRCHHLSWYTMAGEAKRDYPASIFFQSAWWREYAFVETYFARLGVFLAQGEPTAEVLVIHPVESVWCQVRVQWSTMLSPQDPAIAALEETFRSVFHGLCGAQIDFDYGDEEMVGRLGQVGEGPTLRVGAAAYRTVVVAGMTTIRSSTLDLLNAFAAAGGRVIFAGPPPEFVDALRSRAAIAAADRAIRVEPPDLPAAVADGLTERVQVLDAATGQPIPDVFARTRSDGERRFVHLLNVNRDAGHPATRIRLPGSGDVQEWRATDGERHALPAAVVGGHPEVSLSFGPGEGHLLSVGPPEKGATSIPHRPGRPVATLPGPFPYTLSEPNVCVLDIAAARWEGEPWQPPAEILQVDRALRRRLGLPQRGGDMVQPWFRGDSKGQPLGSLELRFDFTVRDVLDPVDLAVERPGDFTIAVNGHVIDPRTERWWVDPCFRLLRIPPGVVVPGDNWVTLRTSFHESVDLEALYLLGRFGVALDGPRATLTAPPRVLEVGDLGPQGLPFYSGLVTYNLGRLDAVADGVTGLLLPVIAGACARVRWDGSEGQLLPWAPFQADVAAAVRQGAPVALDVFLTRRNTFGPLHLVPPIAGTYGPGHWVTTGDRFRLEHQLLPSGLLDAPVLLVGEGSPAAGVFIIQHTPM